VTTLPVQPDIPITPLAAPPGSPPAPERLPDPVPGDGGSPTGLRKLGVWYHRLTALSFPKRYPIVQFPNWPLILAFLAGQAAGRLHGMPHDDAQAISYLAMILWAYGELAHGVNRFRNLLGLAYVVSTTLHLASALHH
jgi:hypothetical protein